MSLIKQFENGWTQVPNLIINHPDLSFKAKGLWMYINSKPEGWDFAVWRIIEGTKEGEKAIRSGLSELVQLGFLEYKAKVKDGKLAGQEYILRDTQNKCLPKQETPKTSVSQKGGYISKTESSKTIIQEKENQNFCQIQSQEEKIESVKSNPMFEKNKQLKFPNLTDDEIDLEINNYFGSYPQGKPMGAFNILASANLEKLKKTKVEGWGKNKELNQTFRENEQRHLNFKDLDKEISFERLPSREVKELLKTKENIGISFKEDLTEKQMEGQRENQKLKTKAKEIAKEKIENKTFTRDDYENPPNLQIWRMMSNFGESKLKKTAFLGILIELEFNILTKKLIPN